MGTAFWETLSLSPETLQTLKDLLVVLGIGFLLGLEREYAKGVSGEEKELFAGVRTFPLVGLMGYLALFLADRLSEWVYPVVLGCVFAFIIVSYVTYHKSRKAGATTEVSLMVTFLLSGLVFLGEYLLAASLALLMAALLAYKVNLHKAVRALSHADIISILQFAVITALVLPLLPDVELGPYGVFNPYRIWFIVSLFIGLNFLAFFLQKFIGSNYSTLTAGILGGFVSSTAVTWYMSRQAGRGKEGGEVQAASIILASSIMFPRILVWLLVLNLPLFFKLALPVLLLGLTGFGIGVALSRRSMQTEQKGGPTIGNPINLKDALVFAGMFVLILLLVGFAGQQAGRGGVLLAAGISGLTDVDAISISMAEYGLDAHLLDLSAIAILIAALTNTALKYALCLILGNGTLRRKASLGFLPIGLAGLGYLVYLILQAGLSG